MTLIIIKLEIQYSDKNVHLHLCFILYFLLTFFSNYTDGIKDHVRIFHCLIQTKSLVSVHTGAVHPVSNAFVKSES